MASSAELGSRVVVVGSANLDLVAVTPVLPTAGETVLGTEFMQVAGGKGANQAIAAARAGARCAFLGAIGSDSFGVTLKARIDAAGVDTSLLRVVYGTSGVAVIMVDATGENVITVIPGANGAFLGLTAAEQSCVAEADVLVAQLEIPLATVGAAVAAARRAGTRVVLNAAPARELPRELLSTVDVLVVNQVEAAAIAPDPQTLLAMVPHVVVTLGADGARYHSRDADPVHVPAFAVRTVDSTAAGDAFTGALAVGWAEGRDIRDAVRWGCAAGAASARSRGASISLPSRAAIDEIYAG
jgi:ribokinase